MSEMPARIWVRVCGGGVSTPSGKLYTTFVGEDREYDGWHVFVRADIAERMAEAILASIDMIENCADAPKNPDSLPEMVKVHLRQSLSAWKDGLLDAASSEAR
jgi:hypothetical protein